MKNLALLVPVFVLSACGGGSGSSSTAVTPPNTPTTPTPPVITPAPVQEAFTFVDPTATAGNRFGIKAVELTNGNIALRSRGLSIADGAGAVHLYKPLTQELIKSFYGDAMHEELGLLLTPLTNGNLVIASTLKHANGVSDSGEVMLINGETGDQIGSSIVGDNVNDQLGGTGITALSNGNFVIASRMDDGNGFTQPGSVMLINGSTGAQIGNTIYGDNNFDNIGDKVKELSNGNIVVASPQADNGALTGVGEVMLINGTTGAQIGSTITGDQGADLLGSKGITELTNGNYVIASPNDDHAGVTDAGTARLVNGTTGVQVTTINGDDAGDKVANNGVVALMNDKFLVISSAEVFGGISNRGSVRFYNANTGASVGSIFIGSGPDNFYGSGGAFQLSNGNIVVSTPLYENGISDQGSVDLINGTTMSTHIATLLPPLDINSRFGFSGVRPVGNGNFAVVSQYEDTPSINDVGSVRVFNGATGAQVGTTVFGDNAGDSLGNAGVKVLDNGNFIVASKSDDVNGVSDAGSVMLFDGATGAQIGSAIEGEVTSDELSSDGITVLKGNNNYVIASSNVDVNGLADAGSTILVNGSTGVQISDAVMGDDVGDLLGKAAGFGDPTIVTLSNGDYLIVNASNDDNGNADVGKVLYRLGQ
jgi:hypothetical protein